MPRSPIDIMIDRACGIPDGAPIRPAAVRKEKRLPREAQVLLNLADAAEAWHLDPDCSATDKLHEACAEWMALGTPAGAKVQP